MRSCCSTCAQSWMHLNPVCNSSSLPSQQSQMPSFKRLTGRNIFCKGHLYVREGEEEEGSGCVLLLVLPAQYCIPEQASVSGSSDPSKQSQ